MFISDEGGERREEREQIRDPQVYTYQTFIQILTLVNINKMSHNISEEEASSKSCAEC